MTSPFGPTWPAAAVPIGAEDAGADDRADRQHDQIARAEHALERMLTFRDQLGDGLALKQLIHVVRNRR